MQNDYIRNTLSDFFALWPLAALILTMLKKRPEVAVATIPGAFGAIRISIVIFYSRMIL
jgi:hypothetical protein